MDYDLLAKQLSELLSDRDFPITNMAQTAAFIFEHIPDINWAGFYLADANGDLHLGPFQGRVACTFIAQGKGVCGTAAVERKTIKVDDVHAFAGHIACDARSESEVVIPLIRKNQLLGVLDIDSPRQGRFLDEDVQGLQQLADIFLQKSPDWVPLKIS